MLAKIEFFFSEQSCMLTVDVTDFFCSEISMDSLKIGEILEEQKLDMEGEEFDDFFHERSDTHSEHAQRNG